MHSDHLVCRRAAMACAGLAAAWTLAAGAAAGADAPFLDAAPFARVCSWDPHRVDGVRAGRLQEIAAEDLALETELAADADGNHRLEAAAGGEACIGLQWVEARPLGSLRIEFQAAPPGPPRVEFWQGETLWQGAWAAVDGRLDGGGTAWAFTPATPGTLYRKVRWIVPAGDRPVVVRRLNAWTVSPLAAADLLVQGDPPRPGQVAVLEPHNGLLAGRPVGRLSWDMGAPLQLAVQHVAAEAARQAPGDRTTIRFRLPGGGFAVAVDDVLERGPVYLPHAGLFVSRAPAPVGLEQHKAGIAGRETVLERVRKLPDQTRERAMRVTHCDPRLDAGPMMLSLAADNAKFVAEADGTIHCFRNFDEDAKGLAPDCVLTPRFGEHQVISRSQAWGALGRNVAAHADPARALPLRIGDKHYANGLGHHAAGEISIAVPDGHARFEAEVGLQWQGGGTPGSVVFEVLVDGHKQFDSGVMRENDPPRPVSVPLAGARVLTLRLTDAGDGLTCDAGNWCDARLLPADPAAPPLLLTDLCAPAPAPKYGRMLAGGWLPAPETTVRTGGVVYRQRTWVAPLAAENLASAPLWLNPKPLCVVEVTMTNPGTEPADAAASFVLAAGGGNAAPPHVGATAAGRAPIVADGTLVGVFDHGGFPDGRGSAGPGWFAVAGRLPAGASATCQVYLPAWSAAPEEQAGLTDSGRLFDRFKAYWEAIMAPAMRVELPDAWLADVIRANQAHVLVAARNERQGALVAPWVAADRYLVAIDSEGNSPIRGMQCWGHFDYARRAFEYAFSRYRPEGFMTTGYTLMGSGWHLWALGEYMRLAEDDGWFTATAGKPAGLCRWVIAQLAKTRRLGPDGQPAPGSGLMPPGVEADWNAYACYFYSNSYFKAGLEAAGQALKRVGHPDADAVLAAAGQLGEDILREFRRAQAAAPVVALQDGTWVPYSPASVHTPGPMADFFPGQDANRSWAYDVELGPHHMVPLGVMAADAPEAGWMMDHMEDEQFLADGWGAYPAARNRAGWFDMGGFAKVQPYYGRNAEVCALRDDVRPFLRSYFNTLASLVDGTCLSIYEHFANFCYNKTHETGCFLHQSRTMLLTERGRELWLAPMVTDNWLHDGMKISVANAPTCFGPTGYQIVSAVASGHIDAVVEPPTRSAPAAIVLRLRHPEGKPIRAVEVDGQPHADFDNTLQVVRLAPAGATIRVRVDY